MAFIYPVENIPDEDLIYYRIHITDIINNQVNPGAFKTRGDGMSVDWNKYSTPDRLLNVAKNPASNAIVSFEVGALRANEALSVDHDPLDYNRAHSLVNGIPVIKNELQVKARLFLKRLYKWQIRFNDDIV